MNLTQVISELRRERVVLDQAILTLESMSRSGATILTPPVPATELGNSIPEKRVRPSGSKNRSAHNRESSTKNSSAAKDRTATRT